MKKLLALRDKCLGGSVDLVWFSAQIAWGTVLVCLILQGVPLLF